MSVNTSARLVINFNMKAADNGVVKLHVTGVIAANLECSIEYKFILTCIAMFNLYFDDGTDEFFLCSISASANAPVIGNDAHSLCPKNLKSDYLIRGIMGISWQWVEFVLATNRCWLHSLDSS